MNWLSRYLRPSLLLILLLLIWSGGVSEGWANQVVSQTITVTATTTSVLAIPKSSGLGMIIQIDVSAIGSGDTWTFKAQYIAPSGTTVDLSVASGNITATGVTSLTLTAPYSSSATTPTPTQIVATNTVDGGAKTITYRVLTTFSQTFGVGLDVGSGPLRINQASGTVDVYFPGAMTTPQAPVLTQGSTTGGSCTSAQSYQIYISYTNATGETDLSTFSTFTTSSTTSKITVTPVGIPSNTNTWTAWVARSGDSFANIRGCGSSGARSDNARTTTSADCLCSAIQNPVEPASNTTANKTLYHSVAIPSSLYSSRPAINWREVCPVGCEYATVTAAMAGITDASASNRYVLFIHAPHSESPSGVGLNLKSYITIVGESRTAVKLGEMNFGATPAVDAGLANVTIDKLHINSPGTGVENFYLENVLCSGTALQCFDDSGGGYTIYAYNNVFKASGSGAYGIGIGYTTKWYGSGNYIEVTATDAATASCWWVSSVLAGAQDDGGLLYERNPICIVSSSSAAGSGNVTGLRVNPQGTDVSNVANIVRLYSPIVRVSTSNASYAGRVGCYLVMDALTNSSASSINIYNGDCQATAAGTSAAVVGLGVDADADHANYSVLLAGGTISESGGTSRNAINDAETQAGFTLTVNDVLTDGAYTGAGQIYGTARHPSGKDYHFPLATKPATCAVGETYVDSTGGSVAWCLCTAANTWTAVGGTGTCN